MEEAHIAVQHAGHGLAGGLGVAMRDRDRVILVQAYQDAGVLVAKMVDEAVVKPAIARPGVEADIRYAKTPQHLSGDVAAPSHFIVGFSFRFIQFHCYPSWDKDMRVSDRLKAAASTKPAVDRIKDFPLTRSSAYIRENRRFGYHALMEGASVAEVAAIDAERGDSLQSTSLT